MRRALALSTFLACGVSALAVGALATVSRDDPPRWLVGASERQLDRYSDEPSSVRYALEAQIGYVVFARFSRPVECCAFFAGRFGTPRRLTTTTVGMRFDPDTRELLNVHERCGSFEGCRNAFWSAVSASG